MILLSWFILFLGLLATFWVVLIKSRGTLKYWIRPIKEKEYWILGKALPTGYTPEDMAAALSDANAEVRSHDQSVRIAYRAWNETDGTAFAGVILRESIEGDLSEGCEIRHQPENWVMRLSGANKQAEKSRPDAVLEAARQQGMTLNEVEPRFLSGQSFQVYDWQIETGQPETGESALVRLMERTQQMRDNLVFTVLLTVICIGALGTKQPFLFAAGVLLMVFLSGACKFVFIHQRTDDADEMHLQNY